jgi:ATP-dependent RNA circularization protein (DNA/RNA ligase family)
MKPLGIKSYGSIPHFQGSRVGPSDHHCSPGQKTICTLQKRDKHDVIIVQQKLDGGNVGVCKVNGKVLAITRAGYLAETSPYKTHHSFKLYVQREYSRFNAMLTEGDRICGEWLLTAVGTKYKLPHEPFVPFDIFHKNKRLPYDQFKTVSTAHDFILPQLISYGDPVSIDKSLSMIIQDYHGALEQVEGVVYRVERRGEVDFLCKFVNHDKIDGKYLDKDIFNEMSSEFEYLKY